MTLEQQLQVFEWVGGLALFAFVMLCGMALAARQKHPDRVRKMGWIHACVDFIRWVLGPLAFWR